MGMDAHLGMVSGRRRSNDDSAGSSCCCSSSRRRRRRSTARQMTVVNVWKWDYPGINIMKIDLALLSQVYVVYLVCPSVALWLYAPSWP